MSTSGASRRALLPLTLTTVGVVYGDIGTSPLYALRECFFGSHSVPPTHENVLGVLSLIIYSLVLVVSIKYIAIVLPARMFRFEFRRRGYKPQVLSRTVEDSGTVTSVLIPWNSCGAYHTGVLGVSTFEYLPYCFFNIINPIISLIYGFTGFRMEKYGPGEAPIDDPGSATESEPAALQPVG